MRESYSCPHQAVPNPDMSYLLSRVLSIPAGTAQCFSASVDLFSLKLQKLVILTLVVSQSWILGVGQFFKEADAK